MLISSLEKMEQIVLKNKSLSWEGWNVVELTKSNSGMFKPDGAFVNGSWYIKNIFSVDRDGWRIPNKFVR
jgi:hypothetical protein